MIVLKLVKLGLVLRSFRRPGMKNIVKAKTKKKLKSGMRINQRLEEDHISPPWPSSVPKCLNFVEGINTKEFRMFNATPGCKEYGRGGKCLLNADVDVFFLAIVWLFEAQSAKNKQL